MRMKFAIAAALLVSASIPWRADAATFNFSFAGSGVSGFVTLTYGAATDAKYPQGFEVTGISGSVTDLNSGVNIVNAPITGLVPITHDAPEASNLLAPLDFSRFPVAGGLPAQSHGALSYDNLYYPSGSPATASSYPVHGGFLDIYGLLFNIGGGRVANFWSNGDFTGSGPIDYGFAIVTPSTAVDYVSGGVSITPEPKAAGLLALGAGLLALGGWRKIARSQKVSY